MMWTVTIKFKDNNSVMDGLLFSENDGIAKEEYVFYYVNGIHCLESLKDPNGVEDFVVLGYVELTDYEVQNL